MCTSIAPNTHQSNRISLNALTQAIVSAVKHLQINRYVSGTDLSCYRIVYTRYTCVRAYKALGLQHLLESLAVTPLTQLYYQACEMRATCVATEESEKNESLQHWHCRWFGITSASGEDRIMAARNHSLCAVSERFTKACNNACNESPESHLWGLENVSLSKCELLSHPVHVRQTIFSSQRAPLNYYYHQITDVTLQESFSYKLL